MACPIFLPVWINGILIAMAPLALAVGGVGAVTAAPAAQVASCASSLCSRQE
jgi:hypothetical protein